MPFGRSAEGMATRETGKLLLGDLDSRARALQRALL